MKPFTFNNYLTPEERQIMLRIYGAKERKSFLVNDFPDLIINYQMVRRWKERDWIKIVGSSAVHGGCTTRIWAFTEKAITHCKAYIKGEDLPKRQVQGYN